MQVLSFPKFIKPFSLVNKLTLFTKKYSIGIKSEPDLIFSQIVGRLWRFFNNSPSTYFTINDTLSIFLICGEK